MREALELDSHLSILGIPCYVQRIGQLHMGPTKSHMPLGQLSMETFFSKKSLSAIAECFINRDMCFGDLKAQFFRIQELNLEI